MSRITMLLLLVFLGACTSQAQQAERQARQEQTDAVDDFVAISELEEVELIRTIDRFEYDQLTDSYVIVTTRKKYYLVQFFGRCRELTTWDADVQPDFRYDAKALHAGVDTIRGCRIKTMYEIDEVQAQELEQIGVAPGEERTPTT